MEKFDDDGENNEWYIGIFVKNDEMYMYEMKVDSRKIEYEVAKREIWEWKYSKWKLKYQN